MAESVVWRPSPEYLERSHVLRFMRKYGIATPNELRERSSREPEWFWHAMVKDLGIEFFTPYQKILDVSEGVEKARWFVGGKLNLAYNCLDKHVSGGRGEHLALSWEGEDGLERRLTYRELTAETDRLALGLKSLGIGKGDRVGIFLPMIPEVASAMLACAKIGAIAVPIFSGFGASAVTERLQDSEARVLITCDGTLRRGRAVELKTVADQALERCPSVSLVVVVNRLNLDPPMLPGRDVAWAELIAPQVPPCPCERMESEDPWLLAYTSGTTGQPKGSVHVHGGFLVKIAQEVLHQVDFHEDDRLCWFTDMGWIMGPWELVGALAIGGTLVLMEGAPDFPTADRLWRVVEEHGVTVLGISPTLIRALMKYGDEPVDAHDLSRLRVIASTGEPWNPTPWQWCFEKVGGGTRPLINFSGGTEVGACFLSSLTIDPLKACGFGGASLGMPVDVFDPEGLPLRGSVGELVCTGPWPGMTRGLWKDQERFHDSYWSRWSNVWTHGDWASIDEDGTWYLHGRSDDTIKVAGKRIGPAEIESAAVGHPAVNESGAVAIPHEVKGESIWCFVVLKPGHEASPELAEAVQRQVGQVLGKPFTPDQVRFVSELPKTRSAKILRRAIRARLLGRDAGDLSSLENPAALEEIPCVT